MQPLARADRGLGSAGRCSALGRAYRGAGADWPFGDPRRAHGVAMEGYYWRLWDGASGRSVMALCGVCRAADGSPWAVVALAAHPGGLVRWVNASAAWADPAAPPAPPPRGVPAGGHAVLRGSSRRLAVDLGPDARLDVVLEVRAGWP